MKILFIIIAILILLLMITIHEFGHYIAGKILGFKIDEFSIGFGPKLFSKKKKNGEIFSIRALPLGGYCAFSGETDEEKILAPEKMKKDDKAVFDELRGEDSEKSIEPVNAEKSKGTEQDPVKSEENALNSINSVATNSIPVVEDEADQTEETSLNKPNDKQNVGKNFNEQPPWKRIIVLMAGGIFNLLSAVVFTFIFIAVAGGSGATVTKVYKPIEGNTQCTLQSGDKILSVEGVKLDFYHTLNKALENKKEGDTVTLVVLRDGKEVEVVTPLRKYDPEVEVENGVYPVGMGVGLAYEKASIGEAFIYCVPYTAELSWIILGTFGDLIVGKVPLNQVSGPIGTVNQIADLGMESWAYLLLLLPLIAANLGIFNLFPIPALDGSKVVFTIIEWIRGKPINQKVEGMIHFIGLIVLFGLVMILDVVNLILNVI